MRAEAVFFRPFGAGSIARPTQGLRLGLHSFAALWLGPAAFDEREETRAHKAKRRLPRRA